MLQITFTDNGPDHHSSDCYSMDLSIYFHISTTQKNCDLEFSCKILRYTVFLPSNSIILVMPFLAFNFLLYNFITDLHVLAYDNSGSLSIYQPLVFTFLIAHSWLLQEV